MSMTWKCYRSNKNATKSWFGTFVFFIDRIQCDGFINDNWQQTEDRITLFVGAVAVNSLAQGSLRRFTQ